MDLHRIIWNRIRRLGRIPGAHAAFRAAMGLYYGRGRTVRIRRGPLRGYIWHHMPGDQPWMAMGLYEPEMARIIVDTLRENHVFYDIGAHSGYHTLVASTALGKNGRIVSFEPVPETSASLRENIALNDLQETCAVEDLAVSDQAGKVIFKIPRQRANAHFKEVPAPHIQNQKAKEIEVDCIPLDIFIYEKSGPMPCVVKIDVEGAEVKVLYGAQKLLEDPRKPLFLITTHSWNLYLEVRSILEENNYKVEELNGILCAFPTST